MMQAMPQMPEQFFKPDQKAPSQQPTSSSQEEAKPQLKLNLNIDVDDGKWNSVICPSDLKKIAINTPELDRICAAHENLNFGKFWHIDFSI